MFGLIEFPEDREEAMTMLFFTKQEDIDTYVQLFRNKYPNSKTTFRSVKINKYMCFDAGADDDDCYYKFDPTLQDDEVSNILEGEDI